MNGETVILVTMIAFTVGYTLLSLYAEKHNNG